MRHCAFIAFSISVFHPLACGAQPSFDCGKAGTDTERAICGSSALSELDLHLSQVFKDARSRVSRAEGGRILGDQASWLHQRDDCGSNEICIGNAMKDRIGQLELEGAVQPVPVGEFSGVYCNRDGAEYLVVSGNGSDMRIMVGSVAVNGDSCGTDAMTATATNGGLVAEESGCTLTVFSRGGALVASAAPPDVCDDRFCGFRAHLGEFVFDPAARRPLALALEDVNAGNVCE